MIGLTAGKRKELHDLAARPDREIDLSDIPEIREIPSDAVIGRFYRPKKTAVTIRLDGDILVWLKATIPIFDRSCSKAASSDAVWAAVNPLDKRGPQFDFRGEYLLSAATSLAAAAGIVAPLPRICLLVHDWPFMQSWPMSGDRHFRVAHPAQRRCNNRATLKMSQLTG
jgi:uncharacterized protein (DUF4415 family)